MAEYVGEKNWRDRVTVDHSTEELERQEEALYLSAKSGSLFEPDMTQEEWEKFCRAAETEERERRAKVPRRHSELSNRDRKVLRKGSESIKSAGVRKIIEKREELIKQLRPQCVDVNDKEFEDEILKELGITEEEFKGVDKSLGNITNEDWQELEKRNEVMED